MRATASKWNVADKYGPYGELFFFLIKEEPNVKFGNALDAPCVKYDYAEIFEQDSIYEKMVHFWLVPHRDPVWWSCVWTKRERTFQ